MIISNYVSYNTMLVEDMIKPLIEDAEHFFKKRCKKRIFINIINWFLVWLTIFIAQWIIIFKQLFIR